MFTTYPVIAGLTAVLLLAACGSDDDSDDSRCAGDGRSYASGAIWTCEDGCNSCSCENGQRQQTRIGCAGVPGPAAGKLECLTDALDTVRHGTTWSCGEGDQMCECDDGETVFL